MKEDDPHFTTTWGVGIAFAFIVLFTIYSFKYIFICDDPSKFQLFVGSIFIYGIFYIYFTKDNRRNKIIKDKPLYKGSSKISKWIAIAYFAFAISMMFIGPILAKHYNEIHCK